MEISAVSAPGSADLSDLVQMMVEARLRQAKKVLEFEVQSQAQEDTMDFDQALIDSLDVYA